MGQGFGRTNFNGFFSHLILTKWYQLKGPEMDWWSPGFWKDNDPSFTRYGFMKMYEVWNVCFSFFRFWGLGLLQLHRHHPLLPVGASVIFPPSTSILESFKEGTKYHQIPEETEQIWKTCSRTCSIRPIVVFHQSYYQACLPRPAQAS